MPAFEAAYLQAYRQSVLAEKARMSADMLMDCDLCPRQCHVDRTAGKLGYCRTGRQAVVASFQPHFGEEAPLVGHNGSGTIFFTHCNLLCNFCQNFEISHGGEGGAMTHRRLADMMLFLQAEGCHNINLVTPSHVIPQILSALMLAAADGLTVPLVYNTGGYDRLSSLRLLEGVVDIYMPDFKFWDNAIANRTCHAPDYRETACAALKEMHRQTGDLTIDDAGVAQRGLLVRHLVLPEHLAGTREVMRFIAGEVSVDTYVNIMPQYRPCGRAHEVPALGASLSPSTYEQALTAACQEGITRLDQRRPLIFR
ncbi:MAG: radical SAM protein [Desulfatitalea sp.]|nr:radical SAM protein [Desulfatitalea sp.]NNK01863.1 radical SAM protein [Desulfatitalea sp.]